MTVGDEYFCKTVRSGCVDVRTATVVEISPDRLTARLSNKKTIDCITGKQIGTKKTVYWFPVKYEKETVVKRRNAGMARGFIRRLISVDEIAVALYNQVMKTTGIDVRNYFHRAGRDTIDLISKMKIGPIKKLYRQPEWCVNSNALNGPFGCYYLLNGMVRKPAHCALCKYFDAPQMFPIHKLRLAVGVSLQYMNNTLKINDYDRIESGERPPTREEAEKMEMIFNTDAWTLQECQTYLSLTRKPYCTKDDIRRTVGRKIEYKIKLDEKKKIKF